SGRRCRTCCWRGTTTSRRGGGAFRSAGGGRKKGGRGGGGGAEGGKGGGGRAAAGVRVLRRARAVFVYHLGACEAAGGGRGGGARWGGRARRVAAAVEPASHGLHQGREPGGYRWSRRVPVLPDPGARRRRGPDRRAGGTRVHGDEPVPVQLRPRHGVPVPARG